MPDSIWIDCGDGQGWCSISLNTPLPVSYADTGSYVLIVKLYMPGGDERYSRTIIRIEEEINKFA